MRDFGDIDGNAERYQKASFSAVLSARFVRRYQT
jgi:hypothetical protein